MCLLWLKRGQMLLKRCKNLLQCQAGGITQLGKRKMWLGQKVAGDEAKLCPGEAEELRHLVEPLHCPQEVFALSQHIPAHPNWDHWAGQQLPSATQALGRDRT